MFCGADVGSGARVNGISFKSSPSESCTHQIWPPTTVYRPHDPLGLTLPEDPRRFLFNSHPQACLPSLSLTHCLSCGNSSILEQKGPPGHWSLILSRVGLLVVASAALCHTLNTMTMLVAVVGQSLFPLPLERRGEERRCWCVLQGQGDDFLLIYELHEAPV